VYLAFDQCFHISPLIVAAILLSTDPYACFKLAAKMASYCLNNHDEGHTKAIFLGKVP
jgi:hypothetical protein